MENKPFSRRGFVKTTALVSAALTLPINTISSMSPMDSFEIGIIADVHNDIMHDGERRLKIFLDIAKKRSPEFIIQMGDFCRPYDKNIPFMDYWNAYEGETFHVLGNHDMDGGFSRDQVREFWDMPANFYSFDRGGIHFIVLDGNDPNPKPWSGYNRYIGEAQQAWLKEDLKNTNKPTIVFSHQTLELEEGGVANLKDIQEIFEKANEEAGFQKVLCSLSGHHHTDFMTQINGIYYVQINSASYRWVGDDFKQVRYSEEVDKTHEWIKYTIPYKEPLFTFMKVTKDKITIEPRKTKFVGPGPQEMNGPITHPHDPIVPTISSYKMKIK